MLQSAGKVQQVRVLTSALKGVTPVVIVIALATVKVVFVAGDENSCNGWKVCSNGTTSVPKFIPRLKLDKIR